MRKQANSSSVLKYDESILQSGYSRVTTQSELFG